MILLGWLQLSFSAIPMQTTFRPGAPKPTKNSLIRHFRPAWRQNIQYLTDGHEALEVAEGPRQRVDVAEVDVVVVAPDVAHLAHRLEVVLGAVVVDTHRPAGVRPRHVGRARAYLAQVPMVDRGVSAVTEITAGKG